MSADAALRARLELSLHLLNLTQAEKTLLARDLLQFATPEEALRVAHELLVRIAVVSFPMEASLSPAPLACAFSAAASTKAAVKFIDDESKAREAGGT